MQTTLSVELLFYRIFVRFISGLEVKHFMGR